MAESLGYDVKQMIISLGSSATKANVALILRQKMLLEYAKELSGMNQSFTVSHVAYSRGELQSTVTNDGGSSKVNNNTASSLTTAEKITKHLIANLEKQTLNNPSDKEELEMHLEFLKDKLEGSGKDINDIWDKATIDRINTLHPSIRQNAVNFIVEAQEQGIYLRVTDGYRTFEEQEALYAKGRTAPGNKVTNAKGGYSNHNYGLAFDVVEIVEGKAMYNAENYVKFRDIGINQEFEWGGYWTDPVDLPHFQNMFDYSISELRTKVNNGQVDKDGYVILD